MRLGVRVEVLTAGRWSETWAATGAANPAGPIKTAAISRALRINLRNINLFMSFLPCPSVRRHRVLKCDMAAHDFKGAVKRPE